MDKNLYKKIKEFSHMILIPGVNLLDITDGATHYHALLCFTWLGKNLKLKLLKLVTIYFIGGKNDQTRKRTIIKT